MQLNLKLMAAAMLVCGTPELTASTASLPANPGIAALTVRAANTENSRETKDDVKLDAAKFPANGAGNFAARMPEFEVADVMGVSHKARQLYRGAGAVIMLSVPNLTQYEKQRRWARWLKKEGWPTGAGPRCILLQDISQQPSYRDRVLKLMREKAEEEKNLVMIMDEGGALRKKFGVLENETVILVVDGDGKVIHHETDDVEPEREAARRVATQLQRLSDAASARTGVKLAPAAILTQNAGN